MPLSSESVKQKALNGSELAQVIVDHVRDVLAKDCFFLPTIAYTRCAFSFVITVHGAGLLQAVEVKSRVRKEGAIEGEAPLENPDGDAQFAALERKVTVENPNLTRIHHGLPITVTVKVPPATPENPFPAFEEKKIEYAAGDYPALPEPVDKDVTQREAPKLGVRKTQAAIDRQRRYSQMKDEDIKGI